MARPARRRALRPVGGTPIEDAPWWVLAIFAALLWLIAYPALVGLLAGWGSWHGQRLPVALAAAGLAGLLVAAVTRRRWKRPTRPTLEDPRPPLVRLSTWVVFALLYPNLLFGILVLTHPDRTLTYQQATLLGLLASSVQSVLGWVERARRRRREGGAASAAPR